MKNLIKKYREDIFGAVVILTSIVGILTMTITICFIDFTAVNLCILNDNIEYCHNTGTPADEYEKEREEKFYNSPNIIVNKFSNLHEVWQCAITIGGTTFVTILNVIYVKLWVCVAKYRLQRKRRLKLMSISGTL